MSKMGEHFQEGASFHKSAAEHHADIASRHHAIARASDGEVAAAHKSIGASHEALAKLHAEHAAHQMELCDKAMDTEDLNKLDGLRVVIPSAPTAAERIYGDDGLTMIPRHGQPPAPISPNVPLEFEKVFGTLNEDL